jgi:uncharacterized protein YfdQ (DUF2303 family)
MDESAIKLIQQTAIDADNKRVPYALSDRIIALPENYRVHDLEQYEDGRRRYRGALSTISLSDFVAYTKTQHEVQSETKVPVFINAEKMSAQAYFNLVKEDGYGHADHHATLHMKPTAPYAAIAAMNGRKQSQRDLADWLQDWADYVDPFTYDQQGMVVSRDYGTLGKAVQAIRNITIKATAESETRVGDFNQARTSMEEVEAKSRLELPAGFLFRCEPYLDLSERTFMLRLQALTGEKDPQLVLRIARYEAEQEAMTRDFKQVLTERLGDVAEVTIGTFSP